MPSFVEFARELASVGLQNEIRPEDMVAIYAGRICGNPRHGDTSLGGLAVGPIARVAMVPTRNMPYTLLIDARGRPAEPDDDGIGGIPTGTFEGERDLVYLPTHPTEDETHPALYAVRSGASGDLTRPFVATHGTDPAHRLETWVTFDELRHAAGVASAA